MLTLKLWHFHFTLSIMHFVLLGMNLYVLIFLRLSGKKCCQSKKVNRYLFICLVQKYIVHMVNKIISLERILLLLEVNHLILFFSSLKGQNTGGYDIKLYFVCFVNGSLEAHFYQWQKVFQMSPSFESFSSFYTLKILILQSF